MHQLNPLDNGLLSLESPETPMHIGCLTIYSRVKDAKLSNFDFVVKAVNRKIQRIPQLMHKLKKVPFNLDYPYWVYDEKFRVVSHIHEYNLPEPGNWENLVYQVSKLDSMSIDLSIPPWEFNVISGLAHDFYKGKDNKETFAIFIKVHHAFIDGVSANEFFNAFHDKVPMEIDSVDILTRNTVSHITVDRELPNFEVLCRTIYNSIDNINKKRKVITNNFKPIVKKVLKDFVNNKEPLDKLPITRFNGMVSKYRRFNAFSMEMPILKKISKQLGVRVHDLLLSIIGSGLRKYLQNKNELPDLSMSAMVPVSKITRKNCSFGNKLSFIFPKIFTNVSDPIERLASIENEMKLAKGRNSKKNSTFIDDCYILPVATANLILSAITKSKLIDYVPTLFNTIITSVPSSKKCQFFADAQLMQMFGAGLCYHKLGLFHVLCDYDNQMTISFVACENMMSDDLFYVQCLKESYQEFVTIYNDRMEQNLLNIHHSKKTKEVVLEGIT